MNKGRRYDTKGKLNKKKVIAVIIAIAAIIMFIMGLGKLLSTKPKEDEKIIPIDYYSLYTNSKWGVINSKGEIVIDSAYSEMIQIPNKSKKVFICTYDVDYNTGDYKSKAVNEKNETLYTQYDKIETIQNIDEEGNLKIEENTLKVTKDNKMGLIDLDGKELLPCEYDNIYSLAGVKNSIVITRGNSKGLADLKGNIIISVDYKDIKSLTSKYENGYIIQNEEDKFGVINYNKKISLECKYDEIKNVYDNNHYVVVEEGNLKIVDSEGKGFVEGKFDEISSINGDNIVAKKDGKFGIFSKQGDQIVVPEYDELKFIFSNYYIAKKDNKYGVINLENNIVLDFNYNKLRYLDTADILIGNKQSSIDQDVINRDFNVKLTGNVIETNVEKGFISIIINNRQKFYTFKFEEKNAQDIFKTNTLFASEKNGKFGFVNKKGAVIVDYIYDEVFEQNEYGYSAVKKDGKWGAIDQKGNIVVEPIYTLEENEKLINFIGKWHNSVDSNANYYTD